MVSLRTLFLLVSLDEPASLLGDVRVSVMGWESHSPGPAARWGHRELGKWKLRARPVHGQQRPGSSAREHLCSVHPAFTVLLTCSRGFWKALGV